MLESSHHFILARSNKAWLEENSSKFMKFSLYFTMNNQLLVVSEKLIADLANLQYCHVRLQTNITRGGDFTSPFLYSSIHSHPDTKLLHYRGYLKFFDPETASIFLCNIKDKQVVDNILIFGHTIKSIEADEYDDLLLDPEEVEAIINADTDKRIVNNQFFNKNINRTTLSESELNSRQNEIVSWLRINRIPIRIDEVTGDLIVAEMIKIKPPYEFDSDYVCPTRLILKRMKNIVDSRHGSINLEVDKAGS